MNDQNFYLLDNQKIVEMLSHEPLMMLSFVSKFNYSKGVMSNSIDKSIIIEEMDVDNQIIQSNNLNNLSMEENRENREEIESNIGAGTIVYFILQEELLENDYNDLPLIAPCLSIVKNGIRYVATRYVL